MYDNVHCLEILENKEPISDGFDLALGEGIAGTIIDKMVKAEKPSNIEIKGELELKVVKYRDIFKKYFPEDEAPDTIDDWAKRQQRYQHKVDPRL